MKDRLFQGKAFAAALSTSIDQGLAPIAANEIYPLAVFKRRTGLESASLREMRRNGFVMRRIGRRSFVRGSDFLSWYDNAKQVTA
jgi:hypothetical protein